MTERTVRSLVVVACCVLVPSTFSLQGPAGLLAGPSSGTSYQYISPRPNATRVNPRTTIALRLGSEPIVHQSVQSGVFQVTGSSSGVHRGTAVLSDDQRTVIFRPDLPFQKGERVEVNVLQGMVTISGTSLPPKSFDFTVGSYPVGNGRRSALPAARPARSSLEGTGSSSSSPFPRRVHELPSDFPPIRILKDARASDEPIFLGSFSWGGDTSAPYLMILNRDGTPQYYQRVPAWDFKVQPTGILTYYDEDSAYFNAMDSAYQLIDIYRCGNGYNTNEHELQVMPDGHAWLMSYDGQEVAMDTIVPGGNPHALVFGLIIQELDLQKNVVFEWRSWDHFKITDATQEDLTSADVDYVHGNAIEIDPDSNILISSRNMDEITKIDHETGEIIWRWGGKNNQFTYVNDPVGFEYQHAVRRLPNGNVMIFDNGTFRGYSRALEYTLDEEEHVATLVREYRHDPDLLGWALGYAQRLPNGNTLVGWGSVNPAATEYSATGEVLYEFDLPPEVYTYRAYSFPWRTTAFIPSADTLTFPPCAIGDSTSSHLTINNPTAQDRLLTSFEVGHAEFSLRTATPVYLPAFGAADVEFSFIPRTAGTIRDTLEIWSTDSTTGIMQRVVLQGTAFLHGLVCTPSALEFGEITVGDTIQSAITLSSISGETLVIDTVYTTTPGFTAQPGRLSFSTSDSVLVRFTSPQPGVFTDTLFMIASNPVALVKIPLKAASVPVRLSFAPSAIDFGEVLKGDSLVRSIVVHNHSTRSVTLDSASISGKPFSIQSTMPEVLLVGDSVALRVRFAPIAAGVYLDTVRFTYEGLLTRVPVHGISRDPSSAVGFDSSSVPRTFLLAQNFPNPFNPSTEILYQLAEAVVVRLVVFDLLGREVAVLVNQSQPAGYYAIRFDVKALSSGVYVYRLIAGDFLQSRKMMLMQ